MEKKKICIDAGHYGKYNRSPVVPEYYESDMVWKLHLMQKEILEGYGFEVILTRGSQAADRELYSRGYAAKGCMLFISDHSNACSREEVDYPVVYHGHDNIGGCSVPSREPAVVIASAMGTAQAGRTATRRNSSGGEYYGVLRGARAAGLSDYYIIEHSFHTNARMTRWLLDDANLRKLAEAECRAIAEHYGMAGGGAGDKGGMTKITGKPEATVGQMAAYIKAKNPGVAQPVLDMLPLYLSEGEAENIRGDVAFAQSCLETGNFAFGGSAVTLGQNNFCGMGVTAAGMKGNSFGTPQLGIRAQIQHLKAYASTARLKQECVDPRFGLVSRGCAPYVEYLGMKENPKGKGWAAGAGYGEKILKILAAVLNAGCAQDGSSQAGGGGQEAGAPQEGGGGQAPGEGAAVPGGSTGFTPYLITTACDSLHIRSGPGTGYGIAGAIREPEGKKNKYTIVEEKGGWGRLKSGAGWISLSYTSKAGVPAGGTGFTPYLFTTACDVLNIRSGAGMDHRVVGAIREPEGKKNKYTIVEEKDGWGRLKSGAGWVSLSYARKAP